MTVSLWKSILFSLTFKEEKHFGTSQNRIVDKQFGMERVAFFMLDFLGPFNLLHSVGACEERVDSLRWQALG